MLEKIKEIICEIVDCDSEEITGASLFTEDLGFSSYDFMCLVGRLEEEFDIQVRIEDILQMQSVNSMSVSMKTVDDVMNYIKSYKGEKHER